MLVFGPVIWWIQSTTALAPTTTTKMSDPYAVSAAMSELRKQGRPREALEIFDASTTRNVIVYNVSAEIQFNSFLGSHCSVRTSAALETCFGPL